jgi:hypothetical protein
MNPNPDIPAKTGIVIREINGRICPIIVCEHCGEQIKEPRRAHVLSPVPATGETVSPVFVHKGDCDKFSAPLVKRGQYACGWTPLDVWIVQLLANIGMSHDDLDKALETHKLINGED